MTKGALQTPEQQREATTCPDCGGNVSRSGREFHCESCGLIVDEDTIDHGPEWRSFDREERERTGPARTVTRHDRGLSTEIGRNTDGRGNQLSSDKRRRLARQRQLHSRAQIPSKRERNQVSGFCEIKRISAGLDLGDSITKQACSLFETAQSRNLLVGRSIEAGAAAAVFIACRMNESCRVGAIASYSSCSTETVWHTYRVFERELALPVPIQTAVDFVPEILRDLETREQVDPRIQTAAIDLAREAAASHEVNGKPSGIAAACIYEVGQQQTRQVDWTQRAVADAANVSVVTLRGHWKDIQEVDDTS